MKKKSQTARSLSYQELSSFCAQVAMMLSSGLPLYDGMEALAKMHASEANAEVYKKLSEDVNRTGSIYEALAEEGGWPKYFVEMVGVGQKSGRLEEVMNGLSAHYEREGKIRRAIVSAVTYPLVLGVMMFAIIIVMLTLVMPMFDRVLAGKGLSLESAGSGLMQVGVVLGWVVMILIGILLLAALVCTVLMKTKFRSSVLNAGSRLFPALKRIGEKLTTSRVSNVLAMMLESGFHMDEAMDMAADVLDDESSYNKVKRIAELTANGESVAEALKDARLYDEVYLSMIRIGLEVGCMDTVMKRIAKDHDEQVEEGISRFVSIIEPTLVAALSVVIGAMLLSVLMPIAGVLANIL